ncbi:unnamed protein product [Leptidea sinapis]|uniref:Glycosyltransferase family 92 protein n=1 Tax=Leptidea sinapis TaxID=189913 RepID=A0A5E4R0R7_9NEOP|nr:unnamed protein product [Leptidea sinapis]
MERRTVAAVRVIAATRTHGTEPVVCRIWLTDNRTVTVKARVKPIRENWNMKYSATYVLCLLRGSGVKPQETVGASVAVVAAATPNRPPTNLLTVLDTEPGSGIDFAAFNDCLYRSMSSAGWLLVIDVDEIVVPRRERTLIALLTAMRAAYNPSAKAPSAFLFRNTFFYMHWETRRWASPHAIKNRSKYALRPRDAVELGNHFLWEMAPGVSCVVVDRTAHRWAEELMQRITAEKTSISKTCPIYSHNL